MENWKIALLIGTIGTGAVMLLRGKKSAGIVLAGVGAAVLASEYPEKLEEIRERLPEFADRGMRMIDNLSRAGERITALVEGRAGAFLDEISSYR